MWTLHKTDICKIQTPKDAQDKNKEIPKPE